MVEKLYFFRYCYDPIIPGSESTPGPSTSSESTQGPSTSSELTQRPSISDTAGPSGTSRHRINGQSTLSSYFSNTKPLNFNHQKRVDQQLIKMIVKG